MSLEGKGLLKLNKRTPLHNAARQTLVKIIATHILEDDPEKVIRAATYMVWAREITRIFPQEKLSVYFHSKTVESTKGLITRLVGKLPDQFHNLKRKYRNSGVIKKRQRLSRSSPTRPTPSSPSLSDEKISEDIQWLKKSSSPWDTVLKKWTRTTYIRLQTSKQITIPEYFKAYPALQKPTGHLLLQKDFENKYKGKYTEIYDTFPNLKHKIFELAKMRVSTGSSTIISRDKQIETLLALRHSSEEASNIACLLLIPTLLAVTSTRLKGSQKKVWRPSKAEAREGFITHVTNDSDVRPLIRSRREKFHQLGLTVQPFMIIVGPSLNKIKSYYVVIDETLYVLTNILEAISTCFKLTWVVNAKYSPECHNTWMFVQHAYFLFKTKYDNVSTSTNTLLGELGIDV